MIVEMVLLAGAKLDSGIGAYAGLDASEGCIYDTSFVYGLFKLCVSPAQTRKEKWPAVHDELLSASFEEQLAFVMRAFVENCGSDVDEAGVRDLEKSEMERSLEEQKEA